MKSNQATAPTTVNDHSWSPLLDDALAAQARATAQAIIAQLEAARPDESWRVSLAGGQAGLAVCHAYLAQTQHHAEAATATDLLIEAVERIATTPMPASLYSGFTGVAWAVEHLSAQLLDTDDNDPNKAIDALLIEHLKLTPWRGDYDLIAGLVGLGVYALERLPRATAVECLELIIDRLTETAEHTPQGMTWLTRPELLSGWQRELCPQGHYNLGLAHGVPGVIALLGQACAAGVARAQAELLLKGAVAWLRAQELSPTAKSRFDSWVVPGSKPQASRAAWCYGDPGIAVALLSAARCIHEPEWERAALDLMRGVAARPLEDVGVVDAGLCHGAAGLAHLFNRFYQATGETEFKTSARYWIEQTLSMQQPGRGIAGYAALELGDDGEQEWTAEPGLLTGAAGIALALLAATTSIEPAWDRMLLASIPAGGNQIELIQSNSLTSKNWSGRG